MAVSVVAVMMMVAVMVMVVIMIAVVVIMSRRAGGQYGRGVGDLGVGHQAELDDQLFQRSLPATPVVVGLGFLIAESLLMIGDVADQQVPELVPLEPLRFEQPHGGPEHPGLPRRGEHQLTVGPRRGGRSVNFQHIVGGAQRPAPSGVSMLATPIIESRLTSSVNSASDIDSVPSGRSGITR